MKALVSAMIVSMLVSLSAVDVFAAGSTAVLSATATMPSVFELDSFAMYVDSSKSDTDTSKFEAVSDSALQSSVSATYSFSWNLQTIKDAQNNDLGVYLPKRYARVFLWPSTGGYGYKITAKTIIPTGTPVGAALSKALTITPLYTATIAMVDVNGVKKSNADMDANNGSDAALYANLGGSANLPESGKPLIAYNNNQPITLAMVPSGSMVTNPFIPVDISLYDGNSGNLNRASASGDNVAVPLTKGATPSGVTAASILFTMTAL